MLIQVLIRQTIKKIKKISPWLLQVSLRVARHGLAPFLDWTAVTGVTLLLRGPPGLDTAFLWCDQNP